MMIHGITNINFNGHWEDQIAYKKAYGAEPVKRRVYVPDENENAYQMAIAWKNETGMTPIEWVKVNNPYNQKGKGIEYKFSNASYMPINVLKASAKMELTNKDFEYDKIKPLIELAKLAAQEGDEIAVKSYERKMIDSFKKLPSAKLKEGAQTQMNDYKDGFGSKVCYGLRYGNLDNY